ncbi:MAG TPA: hypothetical protein VGD63_10965 [Steroidobacteraceae bacterium]
MLWVLLPSPVSAQAPFYTDDTGVTEPGTLHVEASDEFDGLQATQYPDLRQNTANLKVNVGLPHGFELDVDAPYITIERPYGTRSSRGIGDTNLGVKWRLPEASTASHLPAFAVSFYTEFPTGDTRQELGSGLIDYWLNLIAQVPVSERTRFNVNLGVLFAGNTSTGVVGIETRRGRVYVGGLSVVHDFSPHLTIGTEVFGAMADTNGLNRTQLQTMLGAQYAIRDGMAVYCGLIAGAYSASPRMGGQIGITLDFPHFFDLPHHSPSNRAATDLAGGGRPQTHTLTPGVPDDL